VPDSIESFTEIEGKDNDKLVEWLMVRRVVMVWRTVIRAAVVEPDGRKAN